MIATQAPRNTVDSKIKQLCDLPVLLPERELTQNEAEAYWGVDRKSLVDCYNKHKARIQLDLDGVK